ncbi:Toxin 1, PIN domain [Serinicoccus hydrothermalis]|uniref:Ribonuclease VapC n=1 Tax=Serinicoccus hydrothermalis TaxID=1758689 RepID=A0A1B1NC37_9MICO|nr:TA system VapC family ribonuclease toxin [Serinicoccus hydrothermalis]ANS78974.1 Toxin 1, PIN domain [Serinicoccus hydrothermalis]
MILDANILLYAVDEDSSYWRPASRWLTDALRGHERIGLPWQSIGAFLRISTHPRIAERPLSAAAAQEYVDRWLAAPPVWVPPATERTVEAYAHLAGTHHITGNLVPDAQLAALALELGVAVVSADSDFARFPEVRWLNPLASTG